MDNNDKFPQGWGKDKKLPENWGKKSQIPLDLDKPEKTNEIESAIQETSEFIINATSFAAGKASELATKTRDYINSEKTQQKISIVKEKVKTAAEITGTAVSEAAQKTIDFAKKTSYNAEDKYDYVTEDTAASELTHKKVNLTKNSLYETEDKAESDDEDSGVFPYEMSGNPADDFSYSDADNNPVQKNGISNEDGDRVKYSSDAETIQVYASGYEMSYENESSSGSKKIIIEVLISCVAVAAAVAAVFIMKSANKSDSNDVSSELAKISESEASYVSPVINIDNNTVSEQNNISQKEPDTEYSEPKYETINESNDFQDVPPGSEKSRDILKQFLPDLYSELISSDAIVMGNPEKFSDNEFSICDIDSDGEAELLVKITTGAMAANGIQIYKAGSSGDVTKETYISSSSVFYANGCITSPSSHNQEGSSPIWPYSVLKYNSQTDSYDSISSVSSWSKTDPDAPVGRGQAFPDEIDTSSTGVVYFIFSEGESDSGEAKDYSDYAKWFNSWNQASPKLNVIYESFSEDNVKKYNPSFGADSQNNTNNQSNSNNNHNISKGYVSTSGDSLFVRSSPEIINSPGKGNKIDSFANGTELTIDYSGVSGTDEWIYVTGKALSGKTVSGYVFREYVREGSSSDVVSDINPYRKGEISSNGLEIEGFTSDYVCYGGEKSRQWICEDKWHITAKRTVYSYGVQWYECWDTDDGDYYGWIDGSFLYFYS